MAEISGLPRQLRLTTAYLHFISVSHFLIGLAVLFGGAYRFFGESIAAFMIIAIFGVMLVVLGIGFEIINAGLKELSYWAWVTAMIACTIHLLVAIMILLTLGTWGIIGSFFFFILGVIGLYGLVVKETRSLYIQNRFATKDIEKIQAT